MKTSISVQTSPYRLDQEANRAPLGELLKRAADIAFPYSNKVHYRSEFTLISRWAIRAVCEEIIRAKQLTVPLGVRMAGQMTDYPVPPRVVPRGRRPRKSPKILEFRL